MHSTERFTGQPQYEAMLAAAVEKLEGRDPADIAEKACMTWTDGILSCESLGRRVSFTWPGFRALAPMDIWHHLTLLQVMQGARGQQPDDRWLSLSDLPDDGSSRGASFDRDVSMALERLSGLDEAALLPRCLALGAIVVPGTRADLCADFAFAPRYPLRLQLWYADDEFPASGKVLVNRGSCSMLGLEAAGTAAVLLVRLLAEAN